ncbi:Homeobox protein cut [Gryllus bimaculatus]|nr:Homeobox protein cut [Gryllus bimaculatus]
MDRAQEEIRMALDAYHRELAKLNSQQQQQQQQHQQHAQLNGVAQDLSMPKDRSKEPGKDKLPNGELLLDADKKDGVAAVAAAAAAASVMDSVADVLRHAGSAFSLVRPKVEPGAGGAPAGGQPSTTGSSTGSSPLSNSILPPAMTPADDFVGSAAASPLQRMASITNSLISQPTTPTHHSPSQRPLKAVLPPITQQQFDMFNNLNTEEIVKKVKEALSQYSISQRLFGESVLGLSQGSVSDLLARPKPWHMLTQKGREPFIRMKMFLEDENAVHKLVASQYKIAPEKLMRTGNYAGGPPCTLGKPQPPVSKMTGHDSLAAKAGHLGGGDGQSGPGSGPPILPPSLQQMVAGGHPTSQGANSVPPPPPPLLVTPPGHHPLASSLPADLKKPHSQGPNPHGLHPHHQQQPPPGALRAMQQHMTPSVYEMAALTQDLDTQVITTKIKEALLANNIGQKIFGEAVLGLSQGSVSELLSKPKPWHMLSIKGREPFIRMQLWLSDANNIDRLQALKNERREANKRRRSSGPGHHGGSSGGGGGADNSSDTSSNDTSEFYHSPSPGPGPPSAKKQRVLFSEEQKEALRLAFALDSYPSMQTIEFLGSELALSSRTITNWFHNHRMRLKQQVPHGMSPDNSNMPPVSREGGSFDPVQFRLLLNQRLLELQKERMGLGGVHLPYSPYFAANNNLAALMGRGLMPPGECDLAGNLGSVGAGNKEQFSGLDLSMSGLKREPDFEDEEDVDSNVGSEDSNMSSSSLRETTVKKESTVVLPPTIGPGAGRSSRRKPAAPQWVNPEWQEVSGAVEEGKEKSGDKEVIINGVCVMQTDDYGISKMSKDEETVRVEPTPVMDRYEDDDEEDQCSDASSEPENQNLETATPTTPPEGIIPPVRSADQGEPEDEGRSNKSEPSSPLFKEEEDSAPQVQTEPALTAVKQEMEDQDTSTNDQSKGDWDENSSKQDALDKLPKMIKTESRQDDGWEY